VFYNVLQLILVINKIVINARFPIVLVALDINHKYVLNVIIITFKLMIHYVCNNVLQVMLDTNRDVFNVRN
jgi:hypothetical protein